MHSTDPRQIRKFAVYCALCGTLLPSVLPASPDLKSSLTYLELADADLDRGGKVGLQQYRLAIGAGWDRGQGEGFGLNFSWSMSDYGFSGATVFGAQAWGEVNVLGLGASYRKAVNSTDLLLVSPSLQFARAEGADWGESLEYGLVSSYNRRFSDTLTLGIGLAAFTGLEETRAFPILAVDWQFADDWHLRNPFTPGPAGPAGLELVYSLSQDWEIALAGGWRSERFRLSDGGTNPDGVGELEGIPLVLSSRWKWSESISASIYGGWFFGGELTAEDRSGNELNSDDLDGSAMWGFSVSGRF